MENDLEENIKTLELFESQIYTVGKQIFEPKSNLYSIDSFATAVMNRSISLNLGFIDMIKANNINCAAPLLRLQLDNVLRFSAVWLVKDPNDFFIYFLKVDKIEKYADKDGKQLRDKHLKEKLSEKYEWVPKVYDATSGYVHLSKIHFYNTLENLNLDNRIISHRISRIDPWATIEAKLEATECMIAINNMLLDFLKEWNTIKRS